MKVPNCITRSRTGEPIKAKPGERTIQFNVLRAGREKIHLLAFLADDTGVNWHSAELCWLNGYSPLPKQPFRDVAMVFVALTPLS